MLDKTANINSNVSDEQHCAKHNSKNDCKYHDMNLGRSECDDCIHAETDTIIIGLTGMPRAGKDTVADFLVSNYGYTKVTLANGVYEIARDVFGMQEKDRDLLIAIGCKMREIDADVWIKQVDKEINRLIDLGKRKFVISDVRFPNEYDWIYNNPSGLMVMVHASTEARSKRPGYNAADDSKESEGLLCKRAMDYVLYNELNKVELYWELYWQVDTMMNLAINRCLPKRIIA